tara:strand:- start:18766 stop:19506 length:741 start_codon:yes stop_codon:yes gene_type:complete
MAKTFLVTGASKGIGRAISEKMLKMGFIVIGLARESENLRTLEDLMTDYNNNSTVVKCDMGSVDEIDKACHEILRNYQHIDGIIHNAGTIHPIKGIFESNITEWNRSIRVNLCGVQSLTSNLQSIIGGKYPTRITTISSGASKRALHGWSSYCVSKAGLDMWTMCMSEEGPEHNISAVSVAPGIVDTGMQSDIRNADSKSFPSLQNFIGFKNNGDLSDAGSVAESLIPICIGKFGENGQRLDIRNL